jgi:hypothetical protein
MGSACTKEQPGTGRKFQHKSYLNLIYFNSLGLSSIEEFQ